MNHEYNWPHELKTAVAAFESDLEWQILAATMDRPHTADELTELFDVTHDSISDAVANLLEGGLVTKRNDGDIADRNAYRIELSEFGRRFVGGLFDAFGDVREDYEMDDNEPNIH